MGNSAYSEEAFESHESSVSRLTTEPYSIASREEQHMLDYLLNAGFQGEEAMHLVHLREHLYDNSEMQQRMAEDSHMLFARWLYEQGEINES